MKKKFEFNQLVIDMIAPIKSIQGLVNLTQNVKSKKEAQEICMRLQQCSKSLDKRINEAVINVSEGKLQL